MKTKLLALLLAGLAWSQQPAAAQRRACVSPAVYLTPLLYGGIGCHHRSACADTVDIPFEPTRWGLFAGLSATNSRHGTLGGAELEGTYRVTPRLQTGLAATVALPTRIQSNLGVTEAAKPMLGLYSLTGRAHFFLLDTDKLRTSLLVGTGAGVATLADRSQQIVDKGQDPSCGCEPSTHAKRLATSVGVVGLAGAAATYKLRPDLWLTAQGYYQQWAGATRFGRQSDVSPWVLSLGVTMPDIWKAAGR
jgi:hypothetical protein